MTDISLNTAEPIQREPSILLEQLREFAESPLAMVGLVLLIVIIGLAIFAPWLAPQNPYDIGSLDIFDSKLPPGSESIAGGTYWLGTDGQARDMFSAILYGLRTSLMVSIVSVLAALIIGTVIGLIAGYNGGRLDSLLMRIVDIQLSFPAILVALILLAILGKGVDKVIIALIVVQWAYFARAARGAAIVERSKEYMEAAECLAVGRVRILFRHLLPNCISPLIVLATIDLAHAIGLEATLSFLGVGVPVTEPSLGMLISNGFEFLLSGRYWISFFPGVALALTLIAINLVGDRLRDVLNPRNAR